MMKFHMPAFPDSYPALLLEPHCGLQLCSSRIHVEQGALFWWYGHSDSSGPISGFHFHRSEMLQVLSLRFHHFFFKCITCFIYSTATLCYHHTIPPSPPSPSPPSTTAPPVALIHLDDHSVFQTGFSASSPSSSPIFPLFFCQINYSISKFWSYLLPA